jgi:hypothetical protein
MKILELIRKFVRLFFVGLVIENRRDGADNPLVGTGGEHKLRGMCT